MNAPSNIIPAETYIFVSTHKTGGLQWEKSYLLPTDEEKSAAFKNKITEAKDNPDKIGNIIKLYDLKLQNSDYEGQLRLADMHFDAEVENNPSHLVYAASLQNGVPNVHKNNKYNICTFLFEYAPREYRLKYVSFANDTPTMGDVLPLHTPDQLTRNSLLIENKTMLDVVRNMQPLKHSVYAKAHIQ